ncbi:MAG: hypothetical protein K0S33_3125 [Bacteroidetes bacterium]|jgi:hypothetical protein|nr:hypothetical protein [Bacteroidota bacterium]
MKKRLLFISSTLVCLAGSLAAQTLTATGTNPVVGDVYIMNVGSYTSPGTAGANQTWNLSAIGTGTAQTTNMVTPASTPGGSSFPGTNVCASAGSGYYSYYTTSASAWQNGGVLGTNGTIPYSDKEDLMRFPFSYTNTYTDPFAATWVSSGGYTTYRSGSVTVTADGYGTLTTLAGTFSNVMRVHFHEVYQDSTDFGGFPYVIEYDNDEYMWYLNGNRGPIAAVYTIMVNGSPSTVGLYKPTVAVGIDENTENDQLFTLFPSPASDQVSIRTKGLNDVETIRISSISGAGVAQMNAAEVFTTNGNYTLDVSTLPSGIYFVELTNKEGVSARKKLVVTK